MSARATPRAPFTDVLPVVTETFVRPSWQNQTWLMSGSLPLFTGAESWASALTFEYR